jgi:hypothetical protein
MTATEKYPDEKHQRKTEIIIYSERESKFGVRERLIGAEIEKDRGKEINAKKRGTDGRVCVPPPCT